MNKTKIEWCDYTWNPITGCTNGCSYCYARKIAMRFDGHFKPTFHKDRLGQPSKQKKPSRIFTCSMGDIFDGEAKIEWGEKVFAVMNENPQHTFYVLTKQPHHLKHYSLICPDGNIWVGVSINRREDLWRIDDLKKYWQGNKFLSIEPLLEDVGEINLDKIALVIIGGQTGSKKIYPEGWWVRSIQRQANRLDIPVFIKSNLCPIQELDKEVGK